MYGVMKYWNWHCDYCGWLATKCFFFAVFAEWIFMAKMKFVWLFFELKFRFSFEYSLLWSLSKNCWCVEKFVVLNSYVNERNCDVSSMRAIYMFGWAFISWFIVYVFVGFTVISIFFCNFPLQTIDLHYGNDGIVLTSWESGMILIVCFRMN